MIHGTNHFASRLDAIEYYLVQYVCDNLAEAREIVDAKIADGSIKIGKPQLKQYERLILDRSEGRYFVETRE